MGIECSGHEKHIGRKYNIKSRGKLRINLQFVFLLCFLAMSIAFIPFAAFSYDNGDDQVADQAVTYGHEIDFNSRYVWRGIALSEGAVMQPTVWLSAFDFTVEAWGNFVINDEPNQGQINEINLIFYYGLEWRGLIMEPSIIIYYYPNQEEAATTEGSLKFSYPIGPVDVFTTHIFDIGEYTGAYFGDAGISYEYEFTPELLLETSAGLGWASSEFNEVNIGLSKSALNLAGGSLSLAYYPTNHLYLRPHVELSTIVDEDLRDEVDDPTLLSGGVAIGLEF